MSPDGVNLSESDVPDEVESAGSNASDCFHALTFDDGTTRFCEDCGESVAFVLRESGEWVEGAVDADLRWTEDGYEAR